MLIVLLVSPAACLSPSKRVEAQADAFGFDYLTLRGTEFRHAAWLSSARASDDGTLHVYIEHDGTPWTLPRQVSTDPTPHVPLALSLMARDPHTSLYLGRPCYFTHALEPPCTPLLWTHHRYSERVVASMAAALERFVRIGDYEAIVLIGYSGGGTLARLIAERVPQTRAVVTLAANLDTDGWARLHGYSALTGSLNPAARPALPRGVHEVHYVGGRDTNVPPAIARSFAARHRAARIVVLENFDHRCCWVSAWPELLENALAEPGAPGTLPAITGRDAS